jgi:hypothetical protein
MASSESGSPALFPAVTHAGATNPRFSLLEALLSEWACRPLLAHLTPQHESAASSTVPTVRVADVVALRATCPALRHRVDGWLRCGTRAVFLSASGNRANRASAWLLTAVDPPALRELHASGDACILREESLLQLAARFTHLEHIDLRGSGRFTDGGLASLASHVLHVRHLDLAGCTALSDVALATAIGTWKRTLTYLNLNDGMALTSRVLGVIRQCERLATLLAARPARGGAPGAVPVFAECRALRKLDLTSWTEDRMPAGAGGVLRNLLVLPDLLELDASFSVGPHLAAVVDQLQLAFAAAVERSRAAAGWQWAPLIGPPAGRSGPVAPAAPAVVPPALTTLVLTWVAGTARELEPSTLVRLVAALPALQHLTLAWHPAVNDSVLDALGAAACAPRLESIDCTYTTVTSEGLLRLVAACPHLRMVRVVRTRVSRWDETAAAVAALRPDCVLVVK